MIELLISLFIFLVKYLLFETYHSTDFEVHRNWKAITNSLPVDLWYYDQTSEWTLDYPPFFAYFEFILGKVSTLFDKGIIDLTNLNYSSKSCIYFMRTSVLLSDIVFGFSLYHLKSTLHLGKKQFIYMIIFLQGCIALSILDNIHFQYNTLLFSIFILSISSVLRNNFVFGAILYCILVNMKHIFICCAPAYLAIYLKFFIFSKEGNLFGKFFKLSLSMISVFLLSFAPFIKTALKEQSTEIFHQILKRLFPFKRGLIHSYWAPNFWAIYTFIDKVAFRILKPNEKSSNQSALGLTQEVSFDILPNITSAVVLMMLGALSGVLILYVLMKSKDLKIDFLKYLNLSCFIFFNFGFHVHEKAIVNNLIILTINYFSIFSDQKHKNKRAEGAESLFSSITIVATLAQYPLINSAKEFPILLILFVVLSLLLSLKIKRSSRVLFNTTVFFGSGILLLYGVYVFSSQLDQGSSFPFATTLIKFQFLPLMLVSTSLAVLVQIIVIKSLE